MSYSGDPSESKVDAVRFLVNDTSNNAATEHFTDEEIEWMLKQHGDNALRAGLMAAIRLRTKFALMADKAVGDLRITYSEMKSSLEGVIATLKSEIDEAGGDVDLSAIPWMDGIETANLRVPAFQIGMHDDFPQAPFSRDFRRDGSPHIGG